MPTERALLTVERIEEVLGELLLHGQTTTSIVVSTPVPARSLRVQPLSCGA
jgi:hypothetical protein